MRATDKARMVANGLPHSSASARLYFSLRQPSAAFKKLDATGRTGRGTDSTVIISEERDGWV